MNTHNVTFPGRQCRNWAPDYWEKEKMVREKSSEDDAVVFTDCSQKKKKSDQDGPSLIEYKINQRIQKDQDLLTSQGFYRDQGAF